MRLLRHSFVVLGLIAATLAAKADTIEFTATVTAQRGLFTVPIGSTFTGYAHYNGYFDYTNPNLFPPPLTSYAFNYPSAPASITDLKWYFIERSSLSTPPGLGLMYVNFSGPALSFSINDGLFTILDPTLELPNEVSWSLQETGTVTYSYISDTPVAPTPEPTSLALVASAIVGAATMKRFRLGSSS